MRSFGSLGQNTQKDYRPYERVTITKLSSEIRVDEKECEALLVQLILDNAIPCRISQVDGFLVKVQQTPADAVGRWSSISKWVDAIEAVNIMRQVQLS